MPPIQFELSFRKGVIYRNLDGISNFRNNLDRRSNSAALITALKCLGIMMKNVRNIFQAGHLIKFMPPVISDRTKPGDSNTVGVINADR
jgi:hypothetical protein